MLSLAHHSGVRQQQTVMRVCSKASSTMRTNHIAQRFAAPAYARILNSFVETHTQTSGAVVRTRTLYLIAFLPENKNVKKECQRRMYNIDITWGASHRQDARSNNNGIIIWDEGRGERGDRGGEAARSASEIMSRICIYILLMVDGMFLCVKCLFVLSHQWLSRRQTRQRIRLRNGRGDASAAASNSSLLLEALKLIGLVHLKFVQGAGKSWPFVHSRIR